MMDSKQVYQYEGLEHFEIRLLLLEPGSGDDPICCHLKRVALEDVRDSYEALSYVWGDPNSTAGITCGGHGLQVTKSLYAALKGLRYSDRVRTLWVDAVCINQHTAERNSQVQRMGEIYSCARNVLVWLGEESDGSSRALDELPRWLGRSPPDIDWNAANIHWSDAPSFQFDSSGLTDEVIAWLNYQQEIFPSIAALFARNWWYRKWVIQELVRAKTAVFICGNHSLNWEQIRPGLSVQELQNAFYHLLGFGLNEEAVQTQENRWINRPNYGFFNATMLAALAKEYNAGGSDAESSLNLESLFWRAKDFRCSDPRDHLFSLLGIVCNVQLPHDKLIHADYKASAAEIAVRLTEYLMHTGPRPLAHFCSVIGHRNRYSDSNLHAELDEHTAVPSWACSYLDSSFSARADIQWSVKDHKFATGEESTAIWKRSSELVLSVKGTILDEIQEIVLSPLYQGFATSSTPAALSSWARKLWEIATRCTPESSDPLELFTELVTYGQSRSDVGRFSQSRPCSQIARSWLDCALHEKFGLPGGPTIGDEPDTWVVEDAMYIVRTRQLFVTASGRIGWAPVGARAGDQVCSIWGEQLLFVISPCGQGHHNLIGPCYLQGLMFGEAKELNFEEDWIHLF